MAPDTSTGASSYDPGTAKLLNYTAEIPGFLDGKSSPRAYLERCLETIARREPEVKAFVCMNVEGARRTADESTKRYKDKRPLSPVDGMPIAVKDMFDTEDMPTEYNSPIFKGNQTPYDAASVFWLRRGGALILGKTVTTEFAFGTPGPTRNPWDTERTPGGSSSGSAAAVGGAMVPVSLGSQVRGSVMRPAAFCGTYALKPSWGAINTQGGFPSPPSIGHLGVLAGSISDMWATSWYISNTAGGDPGHPSLGGDPKLPPARKPKRLIRLETAGWAETPAETRAAFDDVCRELSAKGVEIVGRKDDARIDSLEKGLAPLVQVILTILTWEGRYPLMLYHQRHPEKLGKMVAERMVNAARMTPAEYAQAIARVEALRREWEELRDAADGFIALTATGAAPIGIPVGNPIYGDVSSLVHAPAINLPLAAIEGMPLGLQVMGFYRADYELTALGHWVVHALLRGEG